MPDRKPEGKPAPASPSLPPLRKVDFGDEAQKRNYVGTVFSLVAPTYQKYTAIFSFGRDRAWKKALSKLFPAELGNSAEGQGCLCLDIACGTGDITRLLAVRYPKASICGLDFSAAMLKEAQNQTQQTQAGELSKEVPGEVPCEAQGEVQGEAQVPQIRSEYQNIRWEPGDLCSLPFPPDSIDLLTGGYALPNAPDLDLALSEIYRVLKPGALALFLDLSKSPKRPLALIEYGVLKFWGSFWGLLFKGSPGLYGYLAEHLKNFPDRVALPLRFQKNGLEHLSMRPLSGGMLGLNMCRKPTAKADF